MDRENPFEMVDDLIAQMEQEFESNPLGFGDRSIALDVRDDGEDFVVTADLPGFDKENIEVTLADQTVRIAAERESDIESTDGEFIRRERSHDSASRSVRLPEPVDEEGIKATFANGVLTVTLPKHEAGGGTEIDIE